MDKQRLNDIIESMADWVWEVDSQMRYTFVSGRVEAILGYRPDELLGKTPFDLMPVEETARLTPIVQDILVRKAPFRDLHNVNRHRDGSIRHSLTNGIPVLGTDGTLLGFRGTDRDITSENNVEERLRESDAQLLAIAENMLIGIMLLTDDHVIARANDRLAEILGYASPADMIGLSTRALHLSEDRFIEFGRTVHEPLRQREQLHVEYQLRRQNGSPVHCVLSGRALDAGKPADLSRGLLWVVDDVDDLKRTQRALRESEARYRALFESSNEGMLVIRDGRFVSVNLAAQRILGLEFPDGCCDLALASVSPLTQPDGQDSAIKARQMIELALQRGTHRFEWEYQRGDGGRFRVEATLSRIQLDDDDALLVTWYDLSRQHEIDYLSYHDQLTHLPNARLLRERLTQTIKFAGFARSRVAVLTLDLDGFKHVMDSHRLEVWEQVLKTLAGRLVANSPTAAIVARMNGDVFTIALDDAVDQDWAIHQARRLQACLYAPLRLQDGGELCVTVCIGIALYPDHARDALELMRDAGSALHAAKQAGPGSVVLYAPEMTTASSRRLQLLQQLRQALQCDEFELHYQPKIDLATATIIGSEALIRWRRPDGVLVAPGEFIPLVETTDLVHPVGRWVLHAVLRQMRSWSAAALPLLPVSINIAGPQFVSGTLPEEIAAALSEAGIAPALLQIELLESLLLNDPEQARRQLTAIRELGVTVALDDFGTGYSSLGYLSGFPIDFLKIDRGFINRLTEDPGNLAIVRATIAMAHGLGMRAVAEGVETDAQLTLLHRLGCDLVQGYYTGRPMSADAFAHLIAADPRTVLPPALIKLTTQGVLIVEDDPTQRQLLVAQLANQGVDVFAVECAEAAGEVLAAEQIHLLIADYGLPGMDGITLLQQTREQYPEIVRIMLSAASDADIPAAAINRGGVFRYLTKPCRTADLRDTVREGVQLARMLRQMSRTTMNHPGASTLAA